MRANTALRRLLFWLGLALWLAGCATDSGLRSGQNSRWDEPKAATIAGNYADDDDHTELRQAIVQGGISLIGKQRLEVKGVVYPFDCTGVVLASYAHANIDLRYRFSEFSGNGVRRIFMTLDDEGLLYAVDYPLPGDLIFWDNTYDANKNGKVDDELTHVGLVVAVDEGGLIHYVHHHYRLGAVMEYMNLLTPDDDFDASGRRINSAMRMRGLGGDIGTNAAQVFRIFGQGWRVLARID